jgi:hypothetical protein
VARITRAIVDQNAPIKTFEHARLSSAVIKAVLAAGGDAEDCCVVLLNQIAAQTARLTKLMAIAPKKYRLPDGRVLVWHCPDEQVPFAGEE